MHPSRPFLDAVLLAILAAGAATDVARGKVYNLLTYPGVALGVLLNGLGGPAAIGAGEAALGFLTGFGLLLVAYLSGGLGGGDVKLAGVVGAFLGPLATLYALLYTFVAGAALALGWILWKEGPRGMLDRVLRLLRRDSPTEGEGAPARLRFPFAVAILVGTAWWLAERATGRTLLQALGGPAR